MGDEVVEVVWSLGKASWEGSWGGGQVLSSYKALNSKSSEGLVGDSLAGYSGRGVVVEMDGRSSSFGSCFGSAAARLDMGCGWMLKPYEGILVAPS